MSINFYFHPISPPSRSARLLLLLSKTQYTEKLVDLMKKENTTPEFSLINPNQTVPAIQEGDFKLFETNAIMRYIAISRKLTNLYPQDPQVRAQIDAYLDFHLTGMTSITQFPMDFYIKPALMKLPVPPNKVERLSEVDEILKFFIHVFLQDGKCDYIGGHNSPTLADLRAIIDLSVLFSANFDFEKFPLLKAYITRMFKLPEVTKAQLEFLQIVKQIQPQQNAFISSILCAKPNQTEAIVLYFNPLSSPSRAVRALLILSKIDYTEKIIDVRAGENKTPEFSKINPNQTIPAIQQGPFCLFESHAILRYVADQYRLLSFYPKEDLQQKALIDSYLDFHHTGMKLLGQFVFDFIFGPSMMQLPEPQNKEERLKEVNATIDFFVKTFLGNGKHKYIMGNKTISIADLVAISELSNLFAANYDFSQNQQCAKYIESIFENASIKQANKEFFGFLMQMQTPLNPFIKAIISSNKKKGCC